jgi:hypothetical protein
MVFIPAPLATMVSVLLPVSFQRRVGAGSYERAVRDK